MIRTLIVGSGYLGLRVGRLLAARGEHVLGTTRTPARANALITAGIEPVIADVLDPASLAPIPDTDRVLYCVGFDRNAGPAMRTVYVEGLRNALECLGDRVNRWVYVSSTSVFGGNDGGWVDEETPPEPATESGRVCLDAEDRARDLAARRGLALMVLRLSGLYGPGRIIRRKLVEAGHPIAGDPDKYLNMIQIDDAVQSAVAVLDRGEPGRLYHASDDRPAPRREFYSLIAAHLGAPAPRFETPAPGTPEVTREASNKRISNRRLRAELGVSLAYPDITTGIPASLGEEENQSIHR